MFQLGKIGQVVTLGLALNSDAALAADKLPASPAGEGKSSVTQLNGTISTNSTQTRVAVRLEDFMQQLNDLNYPTITNLQGRLEKLQHAHGFPLAGTRPSITQSIDCSFGIRTPGHRVSSSTNENFADFLESRLSSANWLTTNSNYSSYLKTAGELIVSSIGRGFTMSRAEVGSSPLLEVCYFTSSKPPVTLPELVHGDKDLTHLVQQISASVQRAPDREMSREVAKEELKAIALGKGNPYARMVALLFACADQGQALDGDLMLAYPKLRAALDFTAMPDIVKASLKRLDVHAALMPNEAKLAQLSVDARNQTCPIKIEPFFEIEKLFGISEDLLKRGRLEFNAALHGASLAIAEREKNQGRALSDQELVRVAAEYLHQTFKFSFIPQSSLARGFAVHQLDCDTVTDFICAVGAAHNREISQFWYVREVGALHIVPAVKNSQGIKVPMETLVNPTEYGRVPEHSLESVALWMGPVRKPTYANMIIKRNLAQAATVFLIERVGELQARINYLTSAEATPTPNQVTKLYERLDRALQFGKKLDPKNPLLMAHSGAEAAEIISAAKEQFGPKGEDLFRRMFKLNH